MPKRKIFELPKMKFGKNGDFFVNFCGKKIYLGRDEKIARENFIVFLQETFSTAGRKSSPEPAKKKVRKILVEEVILDYLTANLMHPKYQKIKRAMQALRRLYGSSDAVDFGRVKFQAVRKVFVEENLAYSYVNELMRFVARAFDLAVENEKLPETVSATLSLVKKLRRGEAKTLPPRLDASDVDILTTLPYMSQTVRDMVVLQRLAGMRPSEVFQMKLEHIEMEGNVWIYTPPHSKCERFAKVRVIPLGAIEQDILRRRMEGKRKGDFLFTPADSVRDRWQAGDRDARYLRQLKPTYSKDSYRRAIVRAIERAREAGKTVRHWTPYQLRHSAATAVSASLGRESAGVLLGHSSVRTTAGYDHSERERAVQVVLKRDSVGGQALEAFKEAVAIK